MPIISKCYILHTKKLYQPIYTLHHEYNTSQFKKTYSELQGPEHPSSRKSCCPECPELHSPARLSGPRRCAVNSLSCSQHSHNMRPQKSPRPHCEHRTRGTTLRRISNSDASVCNPWSLLQPAHTRLIQRNFKVISTHLFHSTHAKLLFLYIRNYFNICGKMFYIIISI